MNPHYKITDGWAMIEQARQLLKRRPVDLHPVQDAHQLLTSGIRLIEEANEDVQL